LQRASDRCDGLYPIASRRNRTADAPIFNPTQSAYVTQRHLECRTSRVTHGRSPLVAVGDQAKSWLASSGERRGAGPRRRREHRSMCHMNDYQADEREQGYELNAKEEEPHRYECVGLYVNHVDS